MTVYSNEEEYTEAKKLKGMLNFYSENSLKNAGANLQQSKIWKSNVVKDRELITGQNPASDEELIKVFLEALAEHKN